MVQVYMDKASRANQAWEHTKRMKERHSQETEYSVRHATVYGDFVITSNKEAASYDETVIDADSVSAAFTYNEVGKHIAILNFASYHHPGGGFLNGSKAQEEALCHESNLYNILSFFGDFYEYNGRHKNRSLYTDRAIFAPDVVFEYNNRVRKISVLTCAAPNFSAASQNYKVSSTENTSALRKRIRFILDILNEQQVEIAILGAFGCGVFGQNPAEVAGIFKDESDKTMWNKPIHLIYAIPQGRRDNNLQEFRRVFGVHK